MPDKSMQVGFLGVGMMGQPMAGKLLEGGHPLLIHDINDAAMAPLLAREAQQAASPRDLADRAEVVIVSLPTIAAFRAVLPELAQGSRMKYLVNTCTVGTRFIREIEAALAPGGATLIDSPISGGPSGAAAGTLSVMVSGAPAAIDAVRPLLALWGPTLTVAGDKPGAAQVLKLTNNILCAVALAATSEAFVMGAKAGLDPEVMLRAINAGTGNNTATQTMFPKAVLDRSFRYGAALQILLKDIDLAIELGEELAVPMWVCQAVRQLFHNAAFAGSPQDDMTRIVQYVERNAKFEMPKTR
ncbi:MAG: NAD(P)-dependent oxidoreductase [Rhodospirillales bacterium]|nr:NAD(P)-dependent oxidoreductase [Rhodospirillales bacterium]